MRRAILALALLGCGPVPTSAGPDAAAALDAPGDGGHDALGLDPIDPPDVRGEPADDRPRPAAPNATCATARPVTPGETLSAEPLARGVEVPRVCAGDGFQPYPSLWYRLRVPAGQHLSVTLRRPPASFTLVALRAFRGCGGTCEVGGENVADGTPSLRWTNPGADAEIVLALSSGYPPEDLPTDVTIAVQTPPPNIACASAAALADGVPRRGEDPGFAVDRMAPCAGMPEPPLGAMYYRATVPPRRVLTVATAGAARVILLPACGATSCLAWAEPRGGHATTSWENASDAPRDVVVAVGNDHPTTAGTLDLTATTAAVAAHAHCATPLRVTDGQWLRGERVGAGGDPPARCGTQPTLGPGRFYAVRVEPGDELSASAEAAADSDERVVLRLADGCAPTACAAGTDPRSDGTAWAHYRNVGATARELLLEAGTVSGRVAVFDLRVRVAPPGYRVTTIAAACDDMGGAAAVPLPSGKIFTAPSQPLPFPLRYFGEAVTAWSASNYGYLELWPGAGYTRPSVEPAELPLVVAARIVAPFWSRMSPPTTPFVVARTVGSPRRHLTVQWTDASVGAAGPAERVTFQAQLFADDTIEYHYCAATPGLQATGASASIGLQGDVVPRAVSYAFRRAGAVAAGTALRFSP